MTVETATKVEDLNENYPPATDLLSEIDNHLRLIKATLKYTFAGAASTGVTGFNVVTQSPGNNTTLAASTAFTAAAIAAASFSSSLPSQSGNAGKFISTDGSVASWTYAATLASNTFTGAQIYGDQVVSRGMLKDMGSVYLDKGNSGTATQTLDYTAGSHQKITVTGAHAIATSNWPPTGNTGELLLELVNGAAFAVTWPTVNWVKSDGSFTTTFSGNGVTLQTSGTDFCLLWSRDGGTTVYGKFMR